MNEKLCRIHRIHTLQGNMLCFSRSVCGSNRPCKVKKRRTDRNGLYADMYFERMLFADLDTEQFGSVAVHQAAVIIGREQLFHFMEVFLIKRALT